MRNLLLLFPIWLVSSCFSDKYLTKQRIAGSELIYTFEIPRGYEQLILGSGEQFFQYDYKYPDSLLFYFTQDELGGPNRNNIRLDSSSYNKLLFMYFFADSTHTKSRNKTVGFNLNDTLEFEGRDSLGLYWKDKFIQGYNVGYLKVPQSKKRMFDSAMKSIKYYKKRR